MCIFSFFNFFKIYVFSFGCVGVFIAAWGPFLVVVHGLFSMVESLVAEHGL